MSKKNSIFDVQLDPYEKEIEDALPESVDKLPVTDNRDEKKDKESSLDLLY